MGQGLATLPSPYAVNDNAAEAMICNQLRESPDGFEDAVLLPEQVNVDPRVCHCTELAARIDREPLMTV